MLFQRVRRKMSQNAKRKMSYKAKDKEMGIFEKFKNAKPDGKCWSC